MKWHYKGVNMREPKQLELPFKIKGEMTNEDIPSLKQLMDRKYKRKPRHLAHLSDKAFKELQYIFRGKL